MSVCELRTQTDEDVCLHNGWLVLPIELFIPEIGAIEGAEARFGVQYMSGKLPKTRFPMITFPWHQDAAIKSIPKARKRDLRMVVGSKPHIIEAENSCHAMIEATLHKKRHILRVGIDDETYTASLLDRRYYDLARRSYVYDPNASSARELVAQQQKLIEYTAAQIMGLLGWLQTETED